MTRIDTKRSLTRCPNSCQFVKFVAETRTDEECFPLRSSDELNLEFGLRY